MTYLDKLNDCQKRAVTHKDGALLIIAGAGAGKTRTITYRIAHLIKSGVTPGTILAVTFTNKAAKEMRDRIFSLIKENVSINRPVFAFENISELPTVSTFHALCVKILREFYDETNLKKSFSIFDKSDSLRAVKQAMKSLGVDVKTYEPSAILSFISKHKGSAVSRTDFLKNEDKNDYNKQVASIWEKYNVILTNENALDFDDLLLQAYNLLRKNDNVRRELQSRWKYIHVDEYQDTNIVQCKIMRLLAGSEKNICVVADQDQCIYTWRQARPENVFKFQREFNCKTILLEQNYRSTQTILSAANDIISKNTNRYDKTLFTKNPQGEKIKIYGAVDAGDEARFVISEIQNLRDKNIPLGEIAVLYRTNFQSRIFEEILLYENIPYQILGTRFFERKEIKDLLSYLRASVNSNSFGDIARIIGVPPRGIGKKTLAHMIENKEENLNPAARKKVAEFKKLLSDIRHSIEHMKPSDAIRFTIASSGLEAKYKNGTDDEKERYANMQELVTLATKYDFFENGEGIEKLLEDAALATDQDELEENSNSVKLMTVHASKGLEFDYVFIVGMEEGLFPYEKVDENEDEEEERRLFYVALTRARKEIFLSHAFIRTIYGKQQINTPSEFLTDISSEYLEELKLNEKTKTPKSAGLLDDIHF